MFPEEIRFDLNAIIHVTEVTIDSDEEGDGGDVAYFTEAGFDQNVRISIPGFVIEGGAGPGLSITEEGRLMEEDSTTKTIPVRPTVYERLVYLKREGDTFSDVIERLLERSGTP